MGEFQRVDAAIEATQRIRFDDLLFLLDELVKVDASIITTTG